MRQSLGRFKFCTQDGYRCEDDQMKVSGYNGLLEESVSVWLVVEFSD